VSQSQRIRPVRWRSSNQVGNARSAERRGRGRGRRRLCTALPATATSPATITWQVSVTGVPGERVCDSESVHGYQLRVTKENGKNRSEDGFRCAS
jgi:hypothetical protein